MKPRMMERPTATPPAGYNYRIRGMQSFRQRINTAKGLKASNAAEAAMLIPVIEDYLNQLNTFLGQMARRDAAIRTQRDVRNVVPAMQHVEKPVETAVETQLEPIAEPIPDDDDSYTAEQEKARVDQLRLSEMKKELRALKLAKKTKKAKELEDKIAELEATVKEVKPHLV